jgi:glutaredoxin
VTHMLVEVYGKTMCVSCDQLMNFLDTNGVPYRYHNVDWISFDEVNTALMNRRDPTNRKLPIVFVNGRELEHMDEIIEFFKRPTGIATSVLGTGHIR